MHSVGCWVRVLSRCVRCPGSFAVLERIQAGTVTGNGSDVSQIEWPGVQRRHDTFRILLPPDRLSYFQIEFPAANSGDSGGLGWAWIEVAGTWLGETLLKTITQQASSTNFFFIHPPKLALRYVERANDIYSR